MRSSASRPPVDVAPASDRSAIADPAVRGPQHLLRSRVLDGLEHPVASRRVSDQRRRERGYGTLHPPAAEPNRSAHRSVLRAGSEGIRTADGTADPLDTRAADLAGATGARARRRHDSAVMLWSLRMRYWAWQVPAPAGPGAGHQAVRPVSRSRNLACGAAFSRSAEGFVRHRARVRGRRDAKARTTRSSRTSCCTRSAQPTSTTCGPISPLIPTAMPNPNSSRCIRSRSPS